MISDILALCFIVGMGFGLYRIKEWVVSKKRKLIKAEVFYIYDGDTLSVSMKGKVVRVRLDAIDCPEDGQEWGEISKAGLIKMIGGKKVLLEQHGVDRYGRVVATLYLKKGNELINVNERMVMLGHAWVYRMYYGHLSEERKSQLNRLESWAMSKGVGLWKNEKPIAPWLWRKQS